MDCKVGTQFMITGAAYAICCSGKVIIDGFAAEPCPKQGIGERRVCAGTA